MVKPSRGLRHRTRKIMRKRIRERGAVPPLSNLIIEYRPGDKVYINVDPAVHGGAPHRRYIGSVGTVVGVRGRALIVEVTVGSKTKKLFLLPEHVKPAFNLVERAREVLSKLERLSSVRKEQRRALLSILGRVK